MRPLQRFPTRRPLDVSSYAPQSRRGARAALSVSPLPSASAPSAGGQVAESEMLTRIARRLAGPELARINDDFDRRAGRVFQIELKRAMHIHPTVAEFLPGILDDLAPLPEPAS